MEMFPERKNAVLSCEPCNKLTPHTFTVKMIQNVRYAGGTTTQLKERERAKAGKILAHMFKCVVCGNLRVFGNEIVLAEKPRVNRWDYRGPSKAERAKRVVNPTINKSKGISANG